MIDGIEGGIDNYCNIIILEFVKNHNIMIMMMVLVVAELEVTTTIVVVMMVIEYELK